MSWPWSVKTHKDFLVTSWTGSVFAYVRARRLSSGQYQVTGMGVERQGAEGANEFFARIEGLGLSGSSMQVVLRPEQYQLLQIDAPEVPAEEVKSAARWKIREMVDTHVDDLTLDVLRVGDDRVRVTGQLFVVVTRTALVKELVQLGERLHSPVRFVEVQDTVQRNLQTLAAVSGAGMAERATAALVLGDGQYALLTICAYGELFYSRRIELGAGFVQGAWLSGATAQSAFSEAYVAVPEYVPGGHVDGSYSNEYGGADYGGSSSQASSADDRAQRFVVEVQRSLDVWERTWSSLPLDGLKVFAGERSQELAQWLSQELGTNVSALDVAFHFPGFAAANAADSSYCWPLLGALLRHET